MTPYPSDGPRTLYAFLCSTDDPEQTVVVFSASHGGARRDYLSRGIDTEEAVVRRKPDFDRHAPGPVPVAALLEDGWHYECAHCSRRISMGEDFVEDATDDRLRETSARNAPVRRDLAAFDAARPKPTEAAGDAAHHERWAADRALEDWRRARNEIARRLIEPPLSRAALRIKVDEVFCDVRCEISHQDRIADVNLSHEDAEREAARLWPGATSYEAKRWPYLEPHVHFTPPGFEHPVTWNVGKDELYVAQCDKERWKRLEDERTARDGQGQKD